MAAVPRQRGDDVQLVAAGGELGDDPRQHATGRCGVGLDVRAEHDEAQRAVSHRGGCVRDTARTGRRRSGGRPPASGAPDAAVVNRAARARPAATSSSRRAATSSSAPFHASSSSGSTSAASPATSGKRGAVAADDRRAERHRLDHRRAEPLVLGREDERLGRRQQAVAIGRRDAARADDPRPELEGGDVAGDLVLDETATTEQHEGEVGIAPRTGQQVEQEAVVLVRVGQRRVDDVGPVAEVVALAQLRRRRDVRPVGRRRAARRRPASASIR